MSGVFNVSIVDNTCCREFKFLMVSSSFSRMGVKQCAISSTERIINTKNRSIGVCYSNREDLREGIVVCVLS